MSAIDHNQLVITQANELALNAQKLTLQEKRLAFLLMALVRKDDEDFKTYYMPITDVLSYLGLNKGKSLYGRLRGICKRFMGRVIELDDSVGGTLLIHWVDRFYFMPKGHRDNPLNTSCLQMRLHVDMKPLLLNLKERFGSIAFRQFAHMDSFTSIRLAEILFYSSFGLQKKSVYYDLEDLKRRLSLEGKYNNFAFFRREVLERAQKEYEGIGPFLFTWETKKDGRKVVGLNFHLRTNKKAIIPPAPPVDAAQEDPQLQLPLLQQRPDYNPDQIQADNTLEQNGVDEPVRLELIEKFDPDRIIENANIILERAAEGKVKHLPGAIVSAIKTDYRKKLTPFEEAQQEKKELAKKAFKEKEAQQKQIKQWEDEFSAIRKSKTEAVWNTLGMIEQEQRIEAFRLTENATMQKLHAGKGLDNIGFRMAFFISFEKEVFSEAERDFTTWVKEEKGFVLIQDKKMRDYRIKKTK
jgi:hypothetical protein